MASRLIASFISSDLHHKGDRAHTQSVVDLINSLSPDFGVFHRRHHGRGKFLPEALRILSGVKSPMYGVPGNHDYWSRVPFNDITKCFAATGGAWLVDQQRVIAGGKINLAGMARLGPGHPCLPPPPEGRTFCSCITPRGSSDWRVKI